MQLRNILRLGAYALGIAPLLAGAAPGADIIQNQCVRCHAVTKPADGGLERLLTRKGPDLHYAGVKFNKDWLVAWLQNPSALRPGGVLYARAVKAVPGGADMIDASLVPAHPRLDAADAAAVAEVLMGYGVNDGLVGKGAYKPARPNAMAPLLFNKLRGCASCHSAKPGRGGLSAPELYDSGARLQPDYVVEYIRNPQKFDPHVWMPRLDLNDADVQKLAGYLLTLKTGDAK